MPIFDGEEKYARSTFVSRRDVTRVAKIGHIYLRRADEMAWSPVYSRIERQHALTAAALAEQIEAAGIPQENEGVEHVKELLIAPSDRIYLDYGRELEQYGQVFLH